MSKKQIESVAKMMEDLGLTEIAAESSLLFGLLHRKIHVSKQQFCQSNAAICAGTGPVTAPSAPGKRGKSGLPSVKGAAGAPTRGGKNDGTLSGGGETLAAPMVGVVYLSPEPGAKPFCEVGKQVAAGETLALVEAMKTYNPIKAERSGVVSEILVKDGDTVEFGTPIIVIK